MADLTPIIREHEAPLIRYASRILRNHDEALDAVQETFIKLVRISQEGKKDEIANLKSWLYRVTRNYCFDLIKSGRRKFELQTENGELPENIDPDKNDDPGNLAEKEDLMSRMREIINSLKPIEMEVLSLKLEQGRSYKEIAGITELSVGNVGFILHHAIRKVKQAMTDEDLASASSANLNGEG